MRAYASSAVALLLGAPSISAFAPSSHLAGPSGRNAIVQRPSDGSSALSMADDVKIFDQEAYISESREMRLKHLEEQVFNRYFRAPPPLFLRMMYETQHLMQFDC